MSRKILIVARDFPPHYWHTGGLIRMATLANHLFEEGYEVHVVCLSRAAKWSTVAVANGVHIHPVRMRYFSQDRPSYSVWQRVVKAVLRLPYLPFLPFLIDPSELALPRVRREIKAVARRYEIPIVLVSTPPHSWQRLTIHLKAGKRPVKRVVADFRDPWTDRREMLSLTAIGNGRAQRAEARSLSAASRAVTVTSGLSALLQKKSHRSVTVIENGYRENVGRGLSPDPTLIDFCARHYSDKLIVGYFGGAVISRKLGQNGKNLLRLIDALSSDRLSGKVALVVQGTIRASQRYLFKLHDVLLLPNVDHEQVVANMSHVDAGVGVYEPVGDEHVVMGGKIYDYAGAALPIVLLSGRRATSFLEFLNSNPDRVVFADICRQDQIIEVLLRLWAEKQSGTLARRKWSESQKLKYSREHQNRKYVDLLGTLWW